MGRRDRRDLSELALAAEGDAIVRPGLPSITYAELRRTVDERAWLLERAGARRGTLVAIAAPETVDVLAFVLAAWKLGAAVLPLDARAPRASLDRTLARARPGVLVRSGVELREDRRPIDPRAALLLFTSGSTAEPKGVLLGADGIAANVHAILGYLPVRDAGVVALASPLVYSYGLVGQALTTLVAGATLALLPGATFPNEQLDAIRALSVRGISSVPTTLRGIARLLVERGETIDLRFVASAGAALDGSTAALLEAAFPGAELFNQYGLTEASPRVAAISNRDPAFSLGCAGRAIDGMSVREDGGRILVRGPSVMLGYLDDPEATRAVIDDDGWLVTGDSGRVSEEGLLFIDGRSDGVVKCGGERVSVEEIAAVLRRAPGVGDACVLAEPHPETGVRLAAFVECAPEALGAVRTFVRSELPSAKRPARIVALDALPRTESGKVALRELLAIAGSK